MGPREPRLAVRGALEQLGGALCAVAVEPVHVVQRQVISRPGVEVLRRAQRPPRLGQRDLQLQRVHHRLGDLAAHLVHRIDGGAVDLAPDHAGSGRIAKLHGDLQPSACGLDRPGQAVADAQRRAHPVQGRFVAAHLERGAAGDHEQPPQPRQLDDQVVRQRLGEAAVLVERSEALERQHRDGWPLPVRGWLGPSLGRGPRGGGTEGGHLSDEPEPHPVLGADQPLGGAVVADRLAGGLDPAGHGRLGHDPAVPDPLDDLFAGQQTAGVLHQQPQQGEHLGLDRDGLVRAAQLVRVAVEPAILEQVDHAAKLTSPRRLPEISRSCSSLAMRAPLALRPAR